MCLMYRVKYWLNPAVVPAGIVHIYSILHQRHSTFKGNGILATRAAVIYRARVCQSTSKRLLSKRTASAAFTVKRSRSPKTLTVYTFYQISSSLRVVVRQNVDISMPTALLPRHTSTYDT